MDEILFAAKGCRNTGGAAICTFSITNEAEAAHSVQFEWMSFLVDNMGNQYANNRIVFGSGDLIPGVPMNLSIEARNVASAATLMSASLSYQVDFGRKDGKVMIRNIPISER